MEITPNFNYLTEVPDSNDVLSILAKPVSNWVQTYLGNLNQVQLVTIPQIIKKTSTLVMSPTGSGKTLSAFLGIISELYSMEIKNELTENIYCLYISPLRALGNDIHKNLEIPLADIREQTGSQIRIAKRTGDTPTSERTKLLRKPPHILITTPESFALMLTAPKFKLKLRTIKWIIVDEIHSIAENKRGTMLSLCLERLDHRIDHKITRIGLSATIEPPELIANFLMGNRDVDINIIDFGRKRKLELDILLPVSQIDLAPYSMLHKKHLEIIKSEVDKNKTTLIFTNTRHLSEKMVYELREAFEGTLDDKIGVHHGSLDKKLRLAVEDKLKQGKMKAVFTSTSLEMGIDIGSIDLIMQLGSTKTTRAMLQRIGRSGHQSDQVSRGKILSFSMDDYIESIATANLALKGEIDQIRIPQGPVDVLIQILVGMTIEQKWTLDEAYSIVILAYPYRNLTKTQFKEILSVSANPSNDENGWKYSNLWFDEDLNEFGRRNRARLAYMQNIGTIPSISNFDVVLEGYRTRIGKISENFAERLNESDVFILQARTFKFLRTIGTKILVREVHGEVPTVPSWVGEGQSRTWEISEEISYLYTMLSNYLDTENGDESAHKWLTEEYGVLPEYTNELLKYISLQKSFTQIPNRHRIVIEKYIDTAGSENILVLAIYGKETNYILAHAMAKALTDKYDVNIASITTDNGFLLRLPVGIEFDHENLFMLVNTTNLEELIKRAVRESELFRHRFRYAINRSLMILQKYGKRKISIDQQQKITRWLLKILPKDFLITKETVREILYDTYNYEKAHLVLQEVESGIINISTVPISDIPSPFTHNILLNDHLDLFFIEDKKSLLLRLHQQVLSRYVQDPGVEISLFKKVYVDEYFTSKLTKVESHEVAIKLFFTYPRRKSEISVLQSNLGSTTTQEEFIIDNLASNSLFLLTNNLIISLQHLPFYLSCKTKTFAEKQDYSNIANRTDIMDLRETIAPETGFSLLITEYLNLEGPRTQNEIEKTLGFTSKKIQPILEKLQREQVILVGSFTSSSQQYLLREDRDLLQRYLRQGQSLSIDEDQLLQLRVIRQSLLREKQSDKVDIISYFKEYGPVKDVIGLYARILNFKLSTLRREIISEEIYYGRFLGSRLVFMHKDHLIWFQIISQYDSELTALNLIVYEIIKTSPGISISKMKIYLRESVSNINESVNYLETNLYICRTNWNPLINYTNRGYISLNEMIREKATYVKAIEKAIILILKWFGILTLNDLLRILRINYEDIEIALTGLGEKIEHLSVYSYLYYVLKSDLHKIHDYISYESKSQKIIILSPNDLFFLAQSTTFSRFHTPRLSQLNIQYNNKSCGNLEITLPDSDILQVLNLHILKKYYNDQALITQIGLEIKSITKKVFGLSAVIIEEINFKSINHKDNQFILFVLTKAGFVKKIDHLLGTIYPIYDHNFDAINETRFLFSKLFPKSQNINPQEIFNKIPYINKHQIFQISNSKTEDTRLILSNLVRNGEIHYYDEYLFSKEFWPYLQGQVIIKNEIVEIFNNDESLTVPQILKRTNLEDKMVLKMLEEAVQHQLIENITPYFGRVEYRLVMKKINYLPNQQKLKLINYLVEKFGPIDFISLLRKCQKYFSFSRIELLLLLSDLTQKTNLYASLIIENHTKTLFYYNKGQKLILEDPIRKNQFDKWEIIENYENIFPHIDKQGTHLLLFQGKPIFIFKMKRIVDYAQITTLNFVFDPEEVDIVPLFEEIFGFIENYIFSKGLRGLTLGTIEGNSPANWVKT